MYVVYLFDYKTFDLLKKTDVSGQDDPGAERLPRDNSRRNRGVVLVQEWPYQSLVTLESLKLHLQ